MITNFQSPNLQREIIKNKTTKGHNSARGDNSDKKKNTSKLFLTRNPYMKFQNPSFNFFLNGRTHGRTDARTDGQAKSNMLPTFSMLGA